MILRIVGLWMRWMSRFAPGDTAQDLDHVGAELLRLEDRRPQPRATSR